jgi:hypothetical protein
MSQRPQHLDQILASWPFSPGQVLVREARGQDGRDVLQMRVDMGLLQMETSGRPDGSKPAGFETYLDHLTSLASEAGPDFHLDEVHCAEIDREFYQYYHRRICWLTLKQYAKAVQDADHTLALMDFSAMHAPDPEWSLLHEQYRPFVMFHKIQASALLDLEKTDPPAALHTLDQGLRSLAEVFEKHDALQHFDDDGFVVKLREMREAIVAHYALGPSLAEQLDAAISKEEYELAAELRDQLEEKMGREKKSRESYRK